MKKILCRGNSHRAWSMRPAAIEISLLLLWASSFAAAQGFTGDIAFDLTQVPFSRYGSYIAFSHLTRGPMGNGLYFRTAHRPVRSEIFRIDLIQNGAPVPFREEPSPQLLRLVTDSGEVEICLAEPYLLRLRGHGVGVRLSKMLDASGFLFQRGTKRWEFDAAEQDLRFMLTPIQGKIQTHSDWDGTTAKSAWFEFLPAGSEETFEAAIEEFRSTWQERSYSDKFSDAVAKVQREYQQFIARIPEVPREFQPAAELAAYIDWSAVVMPEGHFTRPSMLMSKNWMNSVWSWDHCFNAMALIQSNPSLAWDQFMLIFDKQTHDGALPDAVTDRQLIWAYSKPPIHGLTLAWLISHSDSIDQKRMAEAYEPLAQWTNWYFRFRDDDHDRLPQYDHGNDSGWDNSTIFRQAPQVESPDLAAYLVLQMKTLADIARRLGRVDESERWTTSANALLQDLLRSYWRNDHFIALHSGDHAPIEADSLLLYLPLALGNQLPENVRAKLIADLKKPGAFLTEHGLSTEKLNSPYYEADGYWRGPIWAPSTFMIVQGLDAFGEREFARELRLRYCRMAAKSGMAENFNAVTGEGLRDRAYTWSASVFLIFAHELTLP